MQKQQRARQAAWNFFIPIYLTYPSEKEPAESVGEGEAKEGDWINLWVITAKCGPIRFVPARSARSPTARGSFPTIRLRSWE